MKHLGDITKINGADTTPVNVIIGGSPCQDLSIAGKRAGLAGERSGLFMEQLRIIKEMRNSDENRDRTGTAIRPRYMVWENVPGAFSSNKGADFGAVLQETIRVVCKEAPPVPMPDKGWPTAGCIIDVEGHWSIAWRVFDAQFWGVPQRRRRIALVADFGSVTAPEILFERKSLSGYTSPCREAREGATRDTQRSADPTSARAVAHAFSLDSAASNRMKSKNPHSGCRAVDKAKTLDTTRPDPSKNQGGIAIVQNMPTYCIDRSDTAGCNGRGWTEGISYTLNTVDRPAVYDTRGNGNGKTVPTITGDHNGHVSDYTAVVCRNGMWAKTVGTLQTDCYENLNSNDTVSQDGLARRLTPLECERLQGFPDGWTAIGNWIDSKGKLHKISESSQYRALGNSIAIPSWRYVLSKISLCCGLDHTMASLFDGIGGFPLIWEELHGKGTCLWASEIEEFPIAVTKKHFAEV